MALGLWRGGGILGLGVWVQPSAPAIPPTNLVAPVVTGAVALGSVLTSTSGTWAGDPAPGITYQWQRNGVDIGGETAATHTIAAADFNTTVRCVVTATNAVGTASAASNGVAISDTSTLNLVVDTTKAGSASTHFILPLDGSSAYNFTVDWGDGSAPQVVTTNTSIDHTMINGAGVKTIKIKENVVGGFPTIYFNNAGDKLKLMQLSQWGTNKWLSFFHSFYGCANLTITATDHATANTSAVTNFAIAWGTCAAMTSFPLINVSGGTNFSFAWTDCTGLTSFPALAMTSATTCTSAWFGCSGLTSFPIINFGGCTDFSNAWRSCSNLTSFPLIDFANAVTLATAWTGCSKLTSFPLINTQNVTSINSAWANCTLLASFPALNTIKVANWGVAWSGCVGLSGFNFPLMDMRALTSAGNMFGGVTLPTATYSAIINRACYGDGGSIPANTRTSITFGGGLSKYDSSAASARSYWISTYAWTFVDAGAA